MEESIYNLIPMGEALSDAEKRRSSQIYKSVYSDKVRKDLAAAKAPGQTMGPAVVEHPSADQYLKRGQGIPRKTVPAEPRTFQVTKPAVPKRDEHPPMPSHHSKDYLKENAVAAITALSKKPQQTVVLDSAGSRQPLEKSGLVPVYSKKKEFGKTPDYLQRRKEEEQREQIEYNTYVKAVQDQSAHQKLSADERDAILQGLRANKEKLHREYQGLSVMVDTVSKRARKKKMEDELAQLEADIDKIEKHTAIYVEK